MQLNGTIMAASEPPEPPPRNPDKINASLKIGVAAADTVRLAKYVSIDLYNFHSA